MMKDVVLSLTMRGTSVQPREDSIHYQSTNPTVNIPGPDMLQIYKLPQMTVEVAGAPAPLSAPQGPRAPFAAWKWKAEFKQLMWLALPTMLMTCSEEAMTVTDLIFMGHRSPAELAAAALANTYCNLMWQFLLGTTFALDTLGSQAVGGEKQMVLVTWCSASFFVTTLLMLPIMVAQYFGNYIGQYVFGQDHAIAENVGLYCRMLIPGMWPLMWSVLLTKYMQVQNAMTAPMVIMFVTFLINIGLNAILVNTLGFKGIPVATTLARGIQFLLLALTVFCYETWNFRASAGPLNFCTSLRPQGTIERNSMLNAILSVRGSRKGNPDTVVYEIDHLATALSIPCTAEEAVQVHVLAEAAMPKSRLQRLLARWGNRRKWEAVEVWEYIKEQAKLATNPLILRQYLLLAVPGGLALAFEVASFDLTTVFAGHLGTIKVASHAIMLTIITFTFMSWPFAISIAASIRVGNLLGAGKPSTAQRSASIAMMLGFFVTTLIGIVIYLLRHVLGSIFSHDAAIISTIAGIAPLAALIQLADGILGPAGGILRGCGRQGILMLFNFIGCCVCGCMVGYLLCFTAKVGLHGLWWGVVSGVFATGGMNLIAVLMVDWEKEKVNAQARG